MADQDRNIQIDISGDTANMATDYGLSGVSLGDAHVGLTKLVWGDESEGNRVTLSQGLPVTMSGQTGPLEIRGKVGGETNDQFQVVSRVNTNVAGKVGYNTLAGGVHHTQFIAVAGNTSGEGYGAYIAVTGSVQGLSDPAKAHPIAITGAIDLRNAMAKDRTTVTGLTAQGIMVQGVEAGATATVAGEVFPGYGFGVPIATTAGRRLNFETDSIRIDNSTIGVSGGRTIVAATDSIRVYGYDGRNTVRTVISSGEDGVTAGFSGDSVKVAVTNGNFNITANVSAVTGVTNGSGTDHLRIQGYPTSDSNAYPVTVRGENSGALEIYSNTGLNTSVTNTVAIDDSDLIASLESSNKPLNSNLEGIKSGTDILPTIRTDITSGNLSAKITEIVKPGALRSGSKSVTGQASTIHNNLQLFSGITIKAHSSNESDILVGNQSLLNSDSSGYPLEPGESIFLEVRNLNAVYVKLDDSSSNGNVINYIGS